MLRGIHRLQPEIPASRSERLIWLKQAGFPIPPLVVFHIESQQLERESGGVRSYTDPAIANCVEFLQAETGHIFGDIDKPLLLAVRLASIYPENPRASAILNIGLNDRILHSRAKDRHVLDSYRRFLRDYACTILGFSSEVFHQADAELHVDNKIDSRSEIAPASLRLAIDRYRAIVGHDFPQNVFAQLEQVLWYIGDLFHRAPTTSSISSVTPLVSPKYSVILQAMVFGNSSSDSGAGLVFSRDPTTGHKVPVGYYSPFSQGNDVLFGQNKAYSFEELWALRLPWLTQLSVLCESLETLFGGMVEIEFVIEHGKPWILDIRRGKTSERAAVQIAFDMVEQKVLEKERALCNIPANAMLSATHSGFSLATLNQLRAAGGVVAKGLGVSFGSASGRIALDALAAKQMAAVGDKVILVREETTPKDLEGMLISSGLLTLHGGVTSHAAVIARSIGLPCIVALHGLELDLQERMIRTHRGILREGDTISMDVSVGEVFNSEPKAVETGEISSKDRFWRILQWIDAEDLATANGDESNDIRMEVWANGDSPEEIKLAREVGARGIGLCRTEHMLRDNERLDLIQRVILADDLKDREDALADFRQIHQEDILAVLDATDGMPIVLRLLDPPLNEFLLIRTDEKPNSNTLFQGNGSFAQGWGWVNDSNPALGLRGVRLAIMLPELIEGQIEAIVQAARVHGDVGHRLDLRVMVPYVSSVGEIKVVRDMLERAWVKFTITDEAVPCPIKLGAMLETPKSVLCAAEIAASVDFVSFGTNDLTQATLALSRDSAGSKLLAKYVLNRILPSDPFQHLDRNGVGQLIEIAVNAIRGSKADVQIGVCGEHAGDPESIDFFWEQGVDYISCSPHYIPSARLRAIQNELDERAH